MRPSVAWTAAASLLFLALLLVMVRLAWISDDAYITLRTIENWLHGHGIVWNVGERVQTYTHPLWMLLLAGLRWLTGEHYYTTIWLGIGLCLAAAAVLCRLARGAAAATAVLAVLVLSRAFGDFSTSGLETPLVFVLLAGLCAVAPRDGTPDRRLLLVSLLTGLLATTRMDLGLLCAPALLACAAGVPRLRALVCIALGLSPFVAWCAFATLYYGTPFPVTAYAKAICVGVAPLDLLRQGWFYVVYVVTTDPLTMAVIAVGTGLGLWRRELRCRGVAIGVLLYCAYVVKVGGDFMSGRFFAPPFVAALGIAARALANARPRWPLLAIGGAIALALAPGLPPFLRAPADEKPPTTAYHGIIDERCFYYWQLGLLAPPPPAPGKPGRTIPIAGATSQVLRAAGRLKPTVFPHGQVGRYAFEAGELVHFVDPWLCDPLLMRLPTWDLKGWRIGHFIRRVPEGYFETLASGTNRIVHPGLRRYYEALHTVISAPVLGDERLATMWRLLRGDFDGDLATYVDNDYRNPPRVRVPARELRNPPPVNAWFDLPNPRIVYEGGIAVLFDGPVTARSLRLYVIGNIVYKLRFMGGDEELAALQIDTGGLSAFSGDPALHEKDVAVPAEVGEFTAVWVDALNPTSEHVACIAGLVPVN